MSVTSSDDDIRADADADVGTLPADIVGSFVKQYTATPPPSMRNVFFGAGAFDDSARKLFLSESSDEYSDVEASPSPPRIARSTRQRKSSAARSANELLLPPQRATHDKRLVARSEAVLCAIVVALALLCALFIVVQREKALDDATRRSLGRSLGACDCTAPRVRGGAHCARRAAKERETRGADGQCSTAPRRAQAWRARPRRCTRASPAGGEQRGAGAWYEQEVVGTNLIAGD